MLAKIEQNQGMSVWSQDQVDVLKNTIAKGFSNDEFALFTQVCARTNLDPFRKQIYAMKRAGKWNPVTREAGPDVITFQTGIDGYRAIAQRSGEYEGQTMPQWCGDDGVWKDVWLHDANPTAARVGVYRRNFREAVYGVARFSAYAQTTRNKEGGVKLNEMWMKMGAEQLAKCAESLALRKAFPEDLSGLYTSDEMAQANNPVQSTTSDGEVIYEAPKQTIEEKIKEWTAAWVKKLNAAHTYDACRVLYKEAMNDGFARPQEKEQLLARIKQQGEDLKAQEMHAMPANPDEGP